MNISRIDASLNKNTSNAAFRIKMDVSQNPSVWNEMASCQTKEDLVTCILKNFKNGYDEEDLLKAADDVSEEIIRLRSSPGTYLVSSEGKALFKLTSDMLFTPPPMEMEDGSMRVFSPRLHPKISSGIVLALHETNKLAELEDKYPNSEALTHLRDPWIIVEKTSALILGQNGPEVGDNQWNDQKEITFEVGKENINGVFQAFNPEFIRVNMFAKSLARKIIALNCKKYLINECVRKTNSTSSWYEVNIYYEV